MLETGMIRPLLSFINLQPVKLMSHPLFFVCHLFLQHHITDIIRIVSPFNTEVF